MTRKKPEQIVEYFAHGENGLVQLTHPVSRTCLGVNVMREEMIERGIGDKTHSSTDVAIVVLEIALEKLKSEGNPNCWIDKFEVDKLLNF